MNNLKRMTIKRELIQLHKRAYSLAFSYYLRRGFVPKELKNILNTTNSLNALIKYNPNWQNQPRVPAGNPNGGQWTDGNNPLINDPPLEPVYPVEALIGGITALSARGAIFAVRIAMGISRGIYSSRKIRKAAKEIEKFFGGKPDRIFRNPSNDIIIMKGNKKIRFDINNPHPHKNPHFHILKKRPNGKWISTGKIKRYNLRKD